MQLGLSLDSIVIETGVDGEEEQEEEVEGE